MRFGNLFFLPFALGLGGLGLEQVQGPTAEGYKELFANNICPDSDSESDFSTTVIDICGSGTSWVDSFGGGLCVIDNGGEGLDNKVQGPTAKRYRDLFVNNEMYNIKVCSNYEGTKDKIIRLCGLETRWDSQGKKCVPTSTSPP